MTNQTTDQKPEVAQFEVSTEEASTNFYWTFGENEVFNLQTTIRGNPTGDEIEAHLRSARMAMSEVVKMGGRAKPIGQQPASPAPEKAVAPVAPDDAPPPPEEPRYEPVEPTPDVIHAVKMEVKPRAVPDGEESRSDLLFYGEGDKYPRLYFNNRTLEDCIKLLAEVGTYKPEHLDKAKTYTVDYRVGWVESKNLNKNGKPYKNIVFVEKA